MHGLSHASFGVFSSLIINKKRQRKEEEEENTLHYIGLSENNIFV